ncbi:MAG TPA: DUF2325 domain-containing protein [Burkholderiaceae bacterium]|jgi:hypothetical protein
MCSKPNVLNVFSGLIRPSTVPTKALPFVDTAPTTAETRGSRRRRLWDLPPQALCPVIGVCLPMPLLRRRLNMPAGNVRATDYELHCGAITECGHRSPMAELLQRELDQRYLRAIRLAAQHKSTPALALWWEDTRKAECGTEQSGSTIAGTLWATLTHPRCDEPLQERVLRDIHMVQHQVGAANRADLQQLEALSDENLVLTRALAQIQQRSTRLLQERAMQIEKQAAELLQQRAVLLGRDTLIASLREDMQALEASVPGLRHRQQQAEQITRQQARIHELEHALLNARQELERQCRRSAELTQAEPDAGAEMAIEERQLPQLGEQAVLCVGGRQSVVPVYRQLIERTGGRFLHHDGGEEDASAKLDASLAAADLVICQTGCISHDAYWRVKDHCKRHGKQCVFVDKPSASSLQRALFDLETRSA